MTKIEALLERKIAELVEKTENMTIGIHYADHVAPDYLQKLALTSPTNGGRSVGVVCSGSQAREFF
jgi:hypothetical protein